MGIQDTHWCNICKRKKVKAKDDYVEFEFPKWEDILVYSCPECDSDLVTYSKRRKPRWRCTACKKTFEKAKEGKTKDIVRKKGIICRSCIDKDEKLKEAVDLMSQASNPAFVALIECLWWKICGNFVALKDNPVRCQHIAVIEDMVYCARGHPGTVELTVEKAEKDRYENTVFAEKLAKMMKAVNKRYPGALDGYEMAIKDNMPWIQPSGVIKTVGVYPEGKDAHKEAT